MRRGFAAARSEGCPPAREARGRKPARGERVVRRSHHPSTRRVARRRIRPRPSPRAAPPRAQRGDSQPHAQRAARPRVRRAGANQQEANASYGDRIIRLRDGWLVDDSHTTRTHDTRERTAALAADQPRTKRCPPAAEGGRRHQQQLGRSDRSGARPTSAARANRGRRRSRRRHRRRSLRRRPRARSRDRRRPRTPASASPR